MVEAEKNLTKIFKKGIESSMKDEKILKKIGKLLTMYGVKDEEKEKFLADMQDAKYDDQDEIEEITEQEEPKVEEEVKTDGAGEEVETEEPKPETPVETEKSTPTDEESKVEEEAPKEDEVPTEQEPPIEETPTEEEPKAEEPVEPVDEQPVEEPKMDVGKVEELEKALEGLNAKFGALMEALQASGVLVNVEPTQPVGVEHNDPMGEEIAANESDILRRLNR